VEDHMKRFLIMATLLTVVACRPPVDATGQRTLIQNKGSDTLVNVAQTWAEAYAKVNAEVAIAVSGGGSGIGISSLINGTADIANASRRMKDQEIEIVRAQGAEPHAFVVGFDALAVVMHKDNPIDVIKVEQLAAIYGEGGDINAWSQLGVTVPGCEGDEIVRVSRQNNSGTYVYFRNKELGENGEYKLGSRDMHGSKDVVNLVKNTPCAIGYSGLAYANEEVKKIAISENGGEGVMPSVESALDETYPIARPLLMYTRDEPAGAVKDYIDWIMSEEGQCILREIGYAPIVDVECR